MKRYKPILREYDPLMMRALYGTGKSKKVSPLEGYDGFTKQLIKRQSSAEVHINDKNIFDPNQSYRLVVYNGKIYSIKDNKGIHLSIIAWLILNKGLRIDNDSVMDWPSMDPEEVGFLCLRTRGKEIYFSESYIRKNSSIVEKRLDTTFKKEKNILESWGGIFTNKFYKEKI